MIEAKSSNESEKDSLSCLKQHIRGLDQSLLKKFLKFLSGSNLVTFTKKSVSFTVPVNEFQRRPIVHTCGPFIEVPSTYNNLWELREDFSKVLSHDLVWISYKQNLGFNAFIVYAPVCFIIYPANKNMLKVRNENIRKNF